jgi:phage shock protein C
MKKLYRSQTDKKIAGVCGGLAEYFNIDATIIRIIFIILLLPGGFPGLLPYVILWIFVPLKPSIDTSKVVDVDPTDHTV